MATRVQKVRVGLFAVASAALLAIVIIVFGGLRFWEERDHYRIVFARSVYGLIDGAKVYYNGVHVGAVTDVDIVPDRPGAVAVTISIEAGTPITDDTEAVLVLAGVTGLKEIDLRGGTTSSQPIASGDTIAEGETTLDILERRGIELTERASTLVDNLIAITDREDYDAILTSAKATADNLAATSEALRAMVVGNDAALRRSIDAIHDTARSASQILDKQVARLVGSVEDVVQDNRGTLRAAIFDLRQASRSFKELARELRQRPSRLLYSKPPRERDLP